MRRMETKEQIQEAIKAASRRALTAKPTNAPRPRRQFSRAYDRPWKSLAMSVHPAQVEKFNKDMKRDGNAGGEYRTDGDFEATCKTSRFQEMKRRGMFDKDGGYTGPQSK